MLSIGDLLGPFFAGFLINKFGRKKLYAAALLFTPICFGVYIICGKVGNSIVFLQKYLLLLYKLVLGSTLTPVHWSIKYIFLKYSY